MNNSMYASKYDKNVILRSQVMDIKKAEKYCSTIMKYNYRT